MSNANVDIASKYRRPRRYVSWAGVIIGLILGIAGGLYIAWEVSPTVEVNTEPWQLTAEDKAHYMVAILMAYDADSNLDRAINRLLTLRYPGDPIQEVANVACQLATTGYVDNSSGFHAVQTMVRFYQSQGRTGCADELILVQDTAPTQVVQIDVPTATLTPPATKTATPEGLGAATATPVQVVVPTRVPQSSYVLAGVSTFCDAEQSGVIEVTVYQANGSTGIPGQQVRVRWDNGESRFYTGLKPERGPAYADFDMEPDRSYIVDLPGRSDPVPQPLSAVPCVTPNGDSRALTSYRVSFRAAG
jgi:hypothetical protein